MEVTHRDIVNKLPEKWVGVNDYVNTLGTARYFEIKDNNVLRIDEVDVLKRQYLVEIDVNRETIRFTDDLVDLEVVHNNGDQLDSKEWKESFDTLTKELTSIGFQFFNTGNGGNEDYLWYALEMDPRHFTKDKLLKATKLWSDYNEERRQLVLNHRKWR